MNAKLYRRFLTIFLVLFLLSAACAMPLSPSTDTPGDQVGTSAAHTLDALRTQVSQNGSTNTPGAITATATPQGATLAPSSTVAPSATSPVLPSSTFTQQVVCDAFAFVDDVTVPDGTALATGSPFTKIWRLRNTGTCTWTPDYAAVFDSGDSMGAPAAQRIGVSVAPGQTVDVAVPMQSPGAPGSYRGYWRMRNAAGVLFSNSARFYVDIRAISVTPASGGYNFAANVCMAEWTGGSKTLPCQGRDGDADGFVLQRNNPILENGYVDDELALLTNPPRVNDGVIRGKYPVYSVRAGDTFVTLIGCEFNAKTCSVRFQLDYQIDNGAIQTLAGWNEGYEGNYTNVSYNLDSLAGKNVRFILTVSAYGASDNDRSLWLLPRIVNIQPPTATPTPTLTPTPTQEGYPAP